MKRYAICLTLMLLAGCTAPQPDDPESTIAPTDAPAPTDATITTPDIILTEAPLPSNTPQPSGTRIEPLIRSQGQLIPLGWSPDGEWFAFRDYFTSKDYLSHLSSGRTCHVSGVDAPPQGHLPQISPYWRLLADGQLLILDNKMAVLTSPCSDTGIDIAEDWETKPLAIVSVSPNFQLVVFQMTADTFAEDYRFIPATFAIYDILADRMTPLPSEAAGMSAGFSWSPDSRYLAVTAQPDPSGLPHKAHVWVVEAATNQIVRLINAELSNIDSFYTVTNWLDNTRFLIDFSLDRGPLLVTMGGAVQTMPELFGLTLPNEDCSAGGCLMHTTAQASDDHLLWYVWQEDYSALLYHGESGEIEPITLQADMHFSPDGQYLLIWHRSGRDDPPALYLRPVDPPQATMQHIAVEGLRALTFADMDAGRDVANLYEWSPESRYFAVAVHSESYSVLYSAANGQEIARWWADGYNPGSPGIFSLNWERIASGVWSPDGKYLLVTGDGGNKTALFLIPIP